MMEITDQNFESKVLLSEIPVVVEFWADWCQPCKRLLPILERLAEEYSGKIQFVKMEADGPYTSFRVNLYNVAQVPTMLFFSKGEIVDRIEGAVPKMQIQRALKML
jgi:thioredoxin 1